MFSKIVFIHKFNDRSGSPRVLRQVINAFKKNNICTELITSQHEDGFLNGVANKEFTINFYRSENKLITLAYYILNQTALFFFCLKYYKEDVVFYINTVSPFGASLAGKIIGKSIIYHIHETTVEPKILKSFLRLIVSLTAKTIIFVSRSLNDLEYFESKNQFVLYNALDQESNCQRDRLEEKKSRDKNTFNVLMVCSMKQYKGIYEYISLANELLHKDEIRFNLVLSANSKDIKAYLKDVYIPENLTIFPVQSDVQKFYKESNLILSLSRPDQWVETFGLTILEGMSFGLPAIVPEVGGPPEIVRNGVEGYQISCYDMDKLKEAVLKLSSDQTLFEELSKNALKRSKNFNLQKFESGLAKIINMDDFKKIQQNKICPVD